jgi:hypothetical protein
VDGGYDDITTALDVYAALTTDHLPHTHVVVRDSAQACARRAESCVEA